SHLEIYKKITYENIDAALILEDDVVINNDLREILDNVTLSTTKPEILLLSRVNKYYKKPLKSINGSYSIQKLNKPRLLTLILLIKKLPVISFRTYTLCGWFLTNGAYSKIYLWLKFIQSYLFLYVFPKKRTPQLLMNRKAMPL
ncbi:TPA: glycosyltransferase family 25 protein, partial [Enterobacter hormaechei]|nr:glycosyltransferase family 25 protein [Enterobacter hormaechei]